MKTKFIGINERGKKIYELEIEQKDCDEINKLAHELKLDTLPDYKESTPSTERFLFG